MTMPKIDTIAPSRERTLSEVDLAFVDALVDALQVNPRVSWAAVGQALDISTVSAARRWRALEADGRAWTSITMGPALSQGAVVQFACRPKDANRAVARLCELPFVFTVGRATGDFDLWALVSAPSAEALAHVILDVLPAEVPAVRVRSHAYERVYGGPRWRLSVLDRQQAEQLREDARRPLRREPPSSLDRRLFAALGVDGRRSWSSLAGELGIAPQSVRRHLERLERRGLVTFRTDLAPPLAGWNLAAMLWLVVDEADALMVGRDLGGWSETRFCASTASRTNLLLIVGLRGIGQLDDLLHRLATAHPSTQVVDRQLVLRFAKVHGRVLGPDGRAARVVPVDPWGSESVGR